MMKDKTAHVVSVSGGKDSLATLLIALARCPAGSVVPIFCDTGNEHEQTHEYLAYLEHKLGIDIHRLKADFSEQIAAKRIFIARDQRTGRDRHGRKLRWTNKAKRRALEVLHPTGNQFLDLCLWKGRFPSRKAPFCTEELKRNMAVGFQLDLLDSGLRVISWQGVRRDESHARRNAKFSERIGPRMWIFRPIVNWTAADVFQYCQERWVKPNPLYMQGMRRVGCMPCINAGKGEIREISARFPGHIERIAQWEERVSAASKRGSSTFFAGAGEQSLNTMDVFEKLNVLSRVEWAKTARGGRQLDLLFFSDDHVGCSSSYGLCDGETS